MDKEVIDLIVQQTNLFTEQEIIKMIVNEALGESSRLHLWSDTNSKEIKLFLAILIWMGLDQKPKIRDYWSRNILYRGDMSSYMSRNRFELLLKFIHFADNEACTSENRLFKIESLLSLLNSKFQKIYNPGPKVSIDESMIPFRGRLKFRQYIPNKRHRYGVKSYVS